MEETTLFESMVICEYLDEVNPPSLHPSDPLRRAVNRSWAEFSSELFKSLYRLSSAEESEGFEQERSRTRKKLEQLEEQLGEGPFFNGPDFALVDAAIAPGFMRLELMEELRPLALFERLFKVKRWSDAVLSRESVRNSVVPELPSFSAKTLPPATASSCRIDERHSCTRGQCL